MIAVACASACSGTGPRDTGGGDDTSGIGSASMDTGGSGSASMGSSAGSASQGSGGATDSASASATAADDESGELKFDLGVQPDGGAGGCDGDSGGMGDMAYSYIWIANSSQGTVSKINTKTGIEEGRFYTSPMQGSGNPSRTSVNLLGDVAVSNRDPGGVTKIAALPEHCVDVSGNGMIETSTGPADILPWGTDECVLWHKDIDSPAYGQGPRPTAWEGGKFNRDTCTAEENPRLWSGHKNAAGEGIFLRLDGATGNTLDTVNYGLWGVQYDYGPYGGAVNADGDLVATGLNTNPAIHIDAETLLLTDLGSPCPACCKYGMTLDQHGDLWVGACFGEGVYYYSFADAQWTVLPNSGGTRVNGIMADRDGNVWGAGSSGCRLVQLDVATKTYVNNNIPLPGCSSPWGVSIDVDGYVWVVDMSASVAFKVHPETYAIELTVAGLIGPYTYSDMTGSGLNLVVNPPG
jgi:streptogramin lyase